jgi:hypothetical protein
METKKRKRRRDRKHAIYKIVVASKTYIGVTVVDGGTVTSIKRRLNKHWYRRNDDQRWDWPIYVALRQVERETVSVELLELVRGKGQAHARERELIAEHKPKLNTMLGG